MDVLVIGSGGREHALSWKIARSPLVQKVYCAPGNGGIAKHAECVPIRVDDHDALLSFAKENEVDLTVVGPENPLCNGVVDQFRAAGLQIFGPNRKAAEIEGSKAFTRDLCEKHHIPSPQSWTFESTAEALSFLEGHRDEKLVVKADGLAAGKGVTICADYEEARKAVTECLDGNAFGVAGHRVVIEEFLEGKEISILAFTDGRTLMPLESAKDHKARFEKNKGPNTGGMGAISPAPAGNPRTLKQAESQILVQSIHALAQEGRPYNGVLYAGLMVTSFGSRLLEFNARFGDPETQPLMLRMESDIVPFLQACAAGELDRLEAGPAWDPRPAACVVAVSEGYPGPYKKGVLIKGLEDLEESDEFMVFHSGTERRLDGHYYTAGGRVLCVTAKAKTMNDALARCYKALESIEFQGMGFRTDIGAR